MLSVRSLVEATFALAISAVSASAVPIAPGSNVITGPDTYQAARAFNAGSTTVFDVYDFTYVTPPLLAGFSTAVAINFNGVGGKGITDLYYVWSGGTEVQVTDSTGTVVLSHSYSGVLPASGPFSITVFTKNPTGHVLANGGGYELRLTITDCDGRNCAPGDVPLPGAVMLFGSVLAGGVGGMQIVRRRRKSKAA